jgi:hypothetical protein
MGGEVRRALAKASVQIHHRILRANLVVECNWLKIQYVWYSIGANKVVAAQTVDEEAIWVRLSRNVAPHGAFAFKSI